jgi:hypothetical protein
MDVEAGAALKQGLGAVKIQKSSQTRAPKEPASIDRDKPTEKDSSYVAILNGLSSLSSSSRRLVDFPHDRESAYHNNWGRQAHSRACLLPPESTTTGFEPAAATRQRGDPETLHIFAFVLHTRCLYSVVWKLAHLYCFAISSILLPVSLTLHTRSRINIQLF